MIFLYLILFALFAISLRPIGEGKSYNINYCDKNTTDILKGLCIWLVFISHITGYLHILTDLSYLDSLAYTIKPYIRQLLVVPFLFVSGYGVTTALCHRKSYNILKKRCVGTLANFDVAVLFFLLLNLILGNELKLTDTLLAFTAWTSLGNSNWYIFAIIICYFLSWLSFKFFRATWKMIITLCTGILIYTVIMYLSGKGFWWYDTVYAYAFGAIFAFWKPRIETIVQRHYLLTLIVSITGFVFFYNCPNYFSVPANLTAVFLSAILLLFTMKVRLENKFLAWSGSHLFPLYIYQRIPMILFSSINGGSLMLHHHYIYIVLCFLTTLLIAYFYKYINISIK